MLTISIIASVFCLSGCENKPKKQVDKFEIIPSEVDETTINAIPGYENLDKKQILKHYTREVSDAKLYDDREAEIVDKFAQEAEQYNTLTVIGDNYDFIDYNECTGIPFSGSLVGFTFLQDINKSYDFLEKTIELEDSASKKALTYSLPNKIRNGAFIIMKSYDRSKWEIESTVLSENRSYITYFPESSDVEKGVYYQFINIVQFKFFSHVEDKTSGILWWRKTEQVDVYSTFNLIQKYEVVLAKNTVDLRFVCESLENVDIGDDELSEEDIKIVQKSTTMTDGSVSLSYIRAELGKQYNVDYAFEDSNGIQSGTINETTTFTQPGKYSFTTTTFFGVSNTTMLYLLDLGDDYGKDIFFGEGLIDSKMRIYDPTKTVQTYLVGKQYHLIDIPNYLPGRYGSLLYFKNESDLKNNDGQTIKTFDNFHELYDDVFSTKGYYIFDLFASNPNTSSGDVIHYQYAYYISNNTAYEPFVNYGLITNPARSNLLATKVIAVSLPTTGGGDYQFIYPYTEEYMKQAYQMAVKIEELNIEIKEKNGKKYYFYKSLENEKVVTTYVDKATMYETLNVHAKKNVNVIYIDNDIPFADEIVDGAIKDLNKKSIENTIRIVENNEVLSDLMTGEIYLNNYVFTQVADFEVESISAIGENNNAYNIEFDKELDSLFTKSEKITIKEKNWNKERVYQTIYSKNNTCELSVSDNGITRTLDIKNDGNKITTASFKFVTANDNYDSQTLIAIDDGKTRTLFSMEEIVGLSLPMGQFEITVINRNKQTYSFSVNRIVDLIGNEQPYQKFNHNPLKRVIDDSAIEFVPDNTNANNTIEMATWLFVVILVGVVIVSAFLTFVVLKLFKR